MNFFNVPAIPDNVNECAYKGGLAVGVTCAIATLAVFYEIDRTIRHNQSAGLARVVLALGGAVCATYAFGAGRLVGGVMGAAVAGTYNLINRGT